MMGLLFAGALALANPPRVEGSAWVLAGDWPEQTELVALARSLPEPLRELPLTLRRVSAPPLGEDPVRPDEVVRMERGGLALGIDGLEGQAARWLAEHPDATQSGEPSTAAALARAIWHRQLIHALVHRLDAEQGWSREPRWRALSAWGWAPGSPSAEADLLSFANPYGAESAAEDLATLAEYLLSDAALPGDPALPARCRLRTKSRTLMAHLGLPPREQGCASLAEVGLDPAQIGEMDVIYARASSRHPASLVGHLMLGLGFGGGRMEVYQLAAFTGDTAEQNPLYVLRGLSGGFPSVVLRASWWSVVQRYARENRGVQRFRLRLSPEQRERLLLRLDETRQGWDRPYLFLTRNCMHYVVELVEAALDSSLNLPRVSGPDLLLARLARMGIVEPVPPTYADELSYTDRARVARELRAESLARLAEANPGEAGRLRAAGRDLDARSPGARARGYDTLTALAPTLGPDNAALALRVLALSEPVEGLHAVRTGEDNASARALRRASAAWSAGGDHPPDTSAELLAALGGAAPDFSQPPHVPLLRLEMMAGSVASTPVFELSTALYDMRLGEPRSFAAPVGVDIRLFPLSASVQGGAAPRLEGSFSALELRRIYGLAPLANPGLYATVLHAERLDGPLRLSPIEAGVALELAQRAQHRDSLGVSAGMAWGLSPFAPSPAWDTVLRAFGRLGAPSEPLSGVTLEAQLVRRGFGDEATLRYGGRLGAQLHIGELQGVDSALAIDGGLSGGAGQPEATVRVGLWLEPY